MKRRLLFLISAILLGIIITVFVRTYYVRSFLSIDEMMAKHIVEGTCVEALPESIRNSIKIANDEQLRLSPVIPRPGELLMIANVQYTDAFFTTEETTGCMRIKRVLIRRT